MEKLTKQQFVERFSNKKVYVDGQGERIAEQLNKAGISEDTDIKRDFAVDIYPFMYIGQYGYYNYGEDMRDFRLSGFAEVKADDILNVEITEDSPKPKPKYDFKPFDEVLVRDGLSRCWKPDIFCEYDEENDNYPYVCFIDNWTFCIPYEGNEDLLGTTNEPKED